MFQCCLFRASSLLAFTTHHSNDSFLLCLIWNQCDHRDFIMWATTWRAQQQREGAEIAKETGNKINVNFLSWRCYIARTWRCRIEALRRVYMLMGRRENCLQINLENVELYVVGLLRALSVIYNFIRAMRAFSWLSPHQLLVCVYYKIQLN